MSKRTKQGAAVEAAPTVPSPYDAPQLMHIEIRMVVLENGVMVVEPSIYTRTDDPRADDLVARYTPLVSAHSTALSNEISRMVTGETEDPTEFLLEPPGPKAGPMPIVKFDRRGGNA